MKRIMVLIILIILNCNIYSSAQNIGNLITSEYNCLNNLVIKLGVTDEFSTLSSSSNLDFCSKTSLVSCSNGYVNSLFLTQSSSNTNLIINSDLSCFSKISSLQLTSTNISPNILYSPLASTLNSLTLNIPKITTFEITQVINLNCDSLYLAFLSTTAVTPIKLSYLKSGANFISISSEDQVEFNNDLTVSTTFKPKLEFTVIKIPNLSNALINDLSIILDNLFDISTYTTLSTFSGIKKLKLSSASYFRYPNELHSISNGILEDLSLSMVFNPIVTTFPNYSVFTKLTTLTIEKAGTFLLSNLTSNYPSSLLNLNFNNLGIKNLEDFSTFNNIKNINLKQNSISNQLPTSFTSTKIKYLDLSSNTQITGTNIGDGYCNTILKLKGDSLISGTLPECYRGHLYDSTILDWFSGTQLTVTPFDALEIIPNMKIENGKTFIFGKNVGFNGASIKTIPSITFDLDVPNQSFYSNSTDLALYTVIFGSANDRVFNLTNNPSYPTPSTIVSSADGTITIKGSYFSYNQSLISVSIDGSPCNIETSNPPTFNTIICKLSPFNSTKTNVQTIITVDKESSKFTLKSLVPNFENLIQDCLNGCSNHGSCNLDTRVCTCDSGWELEADCSSSTKQCKDPTCSGNGVCSTTTGVCKCNQYYRDDICSTPSQFVSSVVAPGEVGGLTILRGWFGDATKTDLKVLIGGKDCPVISVSSKELNCTAAPGSGEQDIEITLYSFTVVATGLFRYYNGFFRCLNDCNEPNGVCDTTTGVCDCHDDWSGFDCGSKDNGGSKTSPGGVSNDDVTYDISVYKIIEYSVFGEKVAEYTLKNSWVVDKENKNIHSFTQNIGGTNAILVSTVEEITTQEDRIFGGVSFQVKPNSIKLSVSIKNYEYQNSLNFIQLQLKSRASSTDDCDYAPDVKESDNNSLNYLVITKNDKKLYGRFLNTVISDGQPTYLSNKLLNSTTDKNEAIVALNLPHCINECIIDPDFSVLVDPSANRKCNSRSWVLPVAIVVPVVVVSIFIVIAILYYKKNRTFIQIKLKTLKDKY